MGAPVDNSAIDARAQARDLSLVFSSSVLLDIARRGRSPLVESLARSTERPAGVDPTYGDFFEHCYRQLWSQHRCEYAYKNAIAGKILLGRHSLRTTRFFSEFRVGDCKADVLLVNGTSTCYEIKTELDDLDRLERQLDTYTRAFDRTFVVTFAACAPRLLEDLPADVGLLVLRDDGSFSTKRDATSHRSGVDPVLIFDSLRRDEYIAIIEAEIGPAPEVPNTRIYGACRDLFSQLPPAVAHDAMVKALRKRQPVAEIVSLISTTVPSLRAAILSAPLTRTDAESLTRGLACDLIW